MCFHTAQLKKVKDLERKYNVKISDENWEKYFDEPRYHLNGFSHPNMLVIPQQRSDVLAPGVWGIVPNYKSPEEIKPYYKEAVKYGSGLNAQSEKLFSHFMYRESVMTQRCIIPVDGFFEPHEHNKKKYPFYIKEKEDKGLALAGIYTVIGTYITFSILTKKASPLFEKIHNLKKRQPVILNSENIDHWLSESLNEDNVKELVNLNFPEEQLDAYTVSKDLFSPKIDSNTQTILEKVEFDGLEGMF
ncbi:SOS response-associated peptidase [Aestuariibaculum sp. M13]|uniref:SOS response-associated peptidase n=1 Tax=Aestuariibaculum sp. M13 TaxID=2967132 RepID=UPI002159D9F2|nr:SOS response-associated peptidase [Aestuariibaculum sp. M13]MCR8668020.1 SOS response-associated peptidase [Aestuariibaculum sp. M13]